MLSLIIWEFHTMQFDHITPSLISQILSNILIYPTLLSFTYPAPALLSPACAAHLLLDMKPALFMTAQSSHVNLPCCFQKLLFSSSHSSPVALIICDDSRAMRVGDTHVPFRTVGPKVYAHRPVVGPSVNCHLQQPLSSEFQLQNFISG